MPHQKFEGERTLMRIHIGESDKWHGTPLHEAIVELLRKEGFSGVTVLRGVGGYGGSSIYHTDKILRLSQDLPVILEIVELAGRVADALPAKQAELANQLRRSSQSIAGNFGEGLGKGGKDRLRYHGYSLSSAYETAAHIEVARRLRLVAPDAHASLRALLLRAVSMLSRMTR